MKRKSIYSLSFLLPLTLTSCGIDTSEVKVSLKEEHLEVASFLNDNDKQSFQNVYENEFLSVSYKEDIDVFKILDKRNNYEWKTGIDSPLIDLESYYDLPRNERKKFAENNPSIEGNMTKNYIAFANSFVTLEIFNKSGANYVSRYYPSGMDNGVTSELKKVKGMNHHFQLHVDYSKDDSTPFDIQLIVDIVFEKNGYDVYILDNNITGKDKNIIKSVIITPFLAATGGVKYFYDTDINDYSAEPIGNEMEPGYAFIPDGPGSLIPFTDNKIANLSAYKGNVYGEDPSTKTGNVSVYTGNMVIKNVTFPVYGASLTNKKSAFVAYAKEGEEYMVMNYGPDNSENLQYNRIYPSFTYNYQYNQIYNSNGDFYSTIKDKKNSFDLSLHFSYLANEDANYIGMAKEYKNYLLDTNQLKQKENNEDDIPLRLDFIMSDTKSSIIGNSNVVVTTIEDVKEILLDVKNNLSIKSVISSLQGWQKSGKATQNPSKASFSNRIGSSSQFKKMMEEMKNDNYDLSFYENYNLLNQNQVTFLNNIAKHASGYYSKYINKSLNFEEEFGYSKADKSYQYILNQKNLLEKKVNIASMTIDGISSNLVSHEDSINRTLAKEFAKTAFKKIKEDKLSINAVSPNSFLYPYVDNYFDFDTFDSSLLIEQETIPFLSYVLHGTMNLFSTYCNFSFYDASAICKMIDYNIYPSFILSKESSYDLNSTNSCTLYSTQYTEYKDLIQSVYEKVNNTLKEVKNAKWISRSKLQDDVYMNSYDNGRKIIINYSNVQYTYDGKVINPRSCEVI